VKFREFTQSNGLIIRITEANSIPPGISSKENQMAISDNSVSEMAISVQQVNRVRQSRPNKIEKAGLLTATSATKSRPREQS
jgi:hypothetical protein